MRWIALLVFAAYAFDAYASNWVYVTSLGQTGQVWIDVDSIAKASGGKTKAWFVVSYTQDVTQTVSPYKKYKSVKQLNYFDCPEKTNAIVQELFYSDAAGAGDLVDSDSFNVATLRYADVAPDTVGEAMLRTTCQKR